MEKLKLQLEHCYGIRKFDEVLDFAVNATIAIYAPDGVLQSSLANTFRDVADGKPSRDRIYPNRATSRVVQDENNANLAAGEVRAESCRSSASTSPSLHRHALSTRRSMRATSLVGPRMLQRPLSPSWLGSLKLVT